MRLAKIMSRMPKVIVQIRWLLLMFGWCAFLSNAHAGKHAFAEFGPTISRGVIEILKKHGMPVEHDHVGNYWFSDSFIPGDYTIYLSQSDDIPQQAVLDIVKLCLDFYEQRGRKERFRIKMYRETQEERRQAMTLGLFGGLKPYFELTIGEKK